MLKLGATVLLVVAAYYGLLFLAQRRLLYQPPPAPSRPRQDRAEVIALTAGAGSTEALYLAPRPATGEPAPLLLFAHGNAELADHWIDAFDQPRAWGWSVLLLEYPGYGRSAGRPSERSIIAAMRAAYDWAASEPRVDPTRIVPYGRSLGGGPAARIATERPVAALILESSFTSVRDFAARFLAPGALVRDRFDVLGALAAYRGPLLVLHGGRDEVIPPAHGRALAAAVPGAEFHELPCGHNDCPRPWDRLGRFFAARGLPPGPGR